MLSEKLKSHIFRNFNFRVKRFFVSTAEVTLSDLNY